MIEGRETVEESTVLNNSDDIINKEWTRDDTSPSSSSMMDEAKEMFERYARARNSDILNENEDLKNKNKELNEKVAKLETENKNFRDNLPGMQLMIWDLEEQLKEAESKLSLYEQGTPSVSVGHCDYIYDVTHFEEDADVNTINYIFTSLLQLTNVKIAPDQYLLDCSAAIIPIFIILTTDKNINIRFLYKGNLHDFCDEWNCNVVPYITDTERAEKLRCNYESLRVQYSSAPIKNCSPALWRRKSNDGKNVTIYRRAYNVKKQLENMLR